MSIMEYLFGRFPMSLGSIYAFFTYFGSQARRVSPLSASGQVLATYELLECILYYSGERDVLTNAQRVNRFWHSVVATSSPLQQKLYFQVPNLSQHISGTSVNPLLLDLDWNSTDSKREAYRRKGASWRRMFIARPSGAEVSIHGIWLMDMNKFRIGWIRIGENLLMGTLYDRVQDAANNQSRQDEIFDPITKWGFNPPSGIIKVKSMWLLIRQHSQGQSQSSHNPLEIEFRTEWE